MGRRLVIFAMLPLALAPGYAWAAAHHSVYDRPLEKTVVRLPSDPANPQARAKRSCFTYPHFMVKEVDLGEVGAAALSITPVAAARKPHCDPKDEGEVVIPGEDWSGYFAGVKGDYVFFTAGDGVNGGMPFAAFDGRSGRKLFEDTAGTELFKSIALADGGVVLRYRRIFDAKCSLQADPKGCWEKVTAETHLAAAAKPACLVAYEKEMKRTPQFAKEVPKVPTIVAYNVEARFSGGRLSFTPLPGPTACWLED